MQTSLAGPSEEITRFGRLIPAFGLTLTNPRTSRALVAGVGRRNREICRKRSLSCGQVEDRGRSSGGRDGTGTAEHDSPPSVCGKRVIGRTGALGALIRARVTDPNRRDAVKLAWRRRSLLRSRKIPLDVDDRIDASHSVVQRDRATGGELDDRQVRLHGIRVEVHVRRDRN